MDFVLDASVSLAWFLPDESPSYADHVLDLLRNSQAFVPAIWPFEFANALLVAERRGRLAGAVARACLDRVRLLPVTVDRDSSLHAFGPVHALARQHGLAVYDAAYLELAARRGIPLASLDEPLSAAAIKAGIPLVGLPPATASR
jgi:predicted nucleic acid-binding protein